MRVYVCNSYGYFSGDRVCYIVLLTDEKDYPLDKYNISIISLYGRHIKKQMSTLTISNYVLNNTTPTPLREKYREILKDSGKFNIVEFLDRYYAFTKNIIGIRCYEIIKTPPQNPSNPYMCEVD